MSAVVFLGEGDKYLSCLYFLVGYAGRVIGIGIHIISFVYLQSFP